MTLIDHLIALIRGEDLPWARLSVEPAAFVDACREHDLTGLIYQRMKEGGCGADWPQAVIEALAHAARADAAAELLRAAEIRAVIGALVGASVTPVLLKGTALAYSAYASPSARPRSDTDLLIRREDVDAARAALAGLGYAASVYCEGELVFCQFEMQKTDVFGVVHAFDVHWKISTQAVFADALGYEELREEARRIEALGAGAYAAGPIGALLLACMHPVMHHRNAARPLWVYDIHLLASSLSREAFRTFVARAVRARMSAVCAHGLRLAADMFHTLIPEFVMPELSASGRAEPSAEYLREGRRWHDELLSSVRGLPRIGDRLRLLREIVFPGPRYMWESYGVDGNALGMAALPVLYLHRGVYGVWKIATGRK